MNRIRLKPHAVEAVKNSVWDTWIYILCTTQLLSKSEHRAISGLKMQMECLNRRKITLTILTSIHTHLLLFFNHFSDVDYVDTWKAMEKLVDCGLIKSVGISNFNSQQIDRLLANCRIKPVTNQVSIEFYSFGSKIILDHCKNQIWKFQIEVSPQINQKKLIKFCQDREIIVTAYCPLGRPMPAQKKPGFLYDTKLIEMSKKYDKTPAQIVFRYLVSDIQSVELSDQENILQQSV